VAERERIGDQRWIAPAQAPGDVTIEAVELLTSDGAKLTGILRTVPAARSVAFLAHPRQDFTHHVLVPELLRRGCAVWTQATRSPNNDLSLVHEQALLDLAAGYVHLRDRGFDEIIAIGHSGGGPLAAYYVEQAASTPAERLAYTPAGKETGLTSAEMPLPSGIAFIAPHPGQGVILSRMIDPSVADERDPLSVRGESDPYDERNGFAPAPAPASYTAEFVAEYRQEQLRRIARIDALAQEMAAETAAARTRYGVSRSAADRRASIAPRIITVYRTDADVRCTDLSLDPNERPYGSVFGRRPDLTNYGLVGFGRLSTADAWLSTWSVNFSRASFVRCAPKVAIPTLFINLTGDQACFPSDVAEMTAAISANDLTTTSVRGTHFLGSLDKGPSSVAGEVGTVIGGWLADRFALVGATA
jgi:pimeloyl-ACP methyl ester carboxylesterase